MREARDGGEALLLAGDRVAALVQVLTYPRPGPTERIPMGQLLAEAAATADPVAPPRTEVNPYVPETLDGDGEALRQVLVGCTECAVRHHGRDIRLPVQRLGHRLDVAEEGLTGLKMLREGGYDVLLVDRHLPDEPALAAL